MREAIVYVGNFMLPDGNAAGKRVLGNLRALEAAGYQPVCLGFRNDGRKGVQRDEIDGIAAYGIPYVTGLKRIVGGAPFRTFRQVLREVSAAHATAAVILYGSLGTTSFNLKVIRYCKRRRIRVLYDIADCYDKPHRTNYLRYLMKKREMHRLTGRVLPRCDGWITISSYLQKQMPDPGRALIVPPLSVRVHDGGIKTPEQPVTFAYASYIKDKNRPIDEWKDRVDAMVDAFCLLDRKSGEYDYRLKLIGFSKRELVDMFPTALRSEYLGKIDELGSRVRFLGRCSNAVAQEEIGQSDFSILLRDSKTSTNAGFPTKVSESLSLGEAVIVYLTSDLGEYVLPGVNGYLAPAPDDLQGIAEVLARAASLDRKQRNLLRKQTVETCRFHYSFYADALGRFINDGKGSGNR